ncbi:multiple organellar RNA editing factor 1, mitochondrial-like isoform X1 [Arachis ipaensis]|uniref:multiple organellar RNA editing factor 1, mitochondrial-like isoform X1 n=1 Tax=Arachis ipaensis TaxID=130454 RepID=UPI0007AF0D71|nr:multiple organellar RNA editing factor 1, mitochondrial-like isoform X1 [Arachis ipaensis]
MAASNSIRLRRTLRAISSLHRSFSSSAATSAPPISLAIRRVLPSAPPAPAPAPWLSRSFRSSSISLWSNISSSASNIPDEMTPTIYCSRAATATTGSSAWTSPETTNPPPKKCVEEAKQKIYACGTTTYYTGFQAVMSEEESKKFESICCNRTSWSHLCAPRCLY